MPRIFAVVLGLLAAAAIVWNAVVVGGAEPAAQAAPVAAQSAPASVKAAAPARPEIGKWGVDLAGMDTKVRPGDDFFRYVNGTWFDNATIPDDRSSTGSFLDLAIRSEDNVQAIIADLDRKSDLAGIGRKVRDLYHSYVDTARLDQLGLAPAQADLKTIAAIKTYDDVARAMGAVPLGTQSLFDAGIGIDDKNPDAYAVFLSQSGLGLPDRDYYLLSEKNIVAAREAYKQYIADMLSMGGIADAPKKAASIFALETRIAKLSWARAERRDADKVYNPMSVDELAKFAPQFPWRTFLGEMGIGAPPQGARRVIVAEKSAFPKLAALFVKTPVPVWRDYLTFHYLSAHAAYLPKKFDDLRFGLYGKVLSGQTQQLARAKRGTHFIGDMMGEAVGELYVARYFPPEAKAKAKDLVNNLLAVYRQRIQTRDWMTGATKKQALAKIEKLMVKIGYPDNWRDYSKYDVVAGDLYGNATRGSVFEWNRELVRLDKPVDRGEWEMSPQTVNAYYNADLNEIVFPAAILQPPFFDPHADDAVNYGGIGAVIGHEISHGFDDQGSKYTAEGILQNWWTPADRVAFDARTKMLVAQFNGYSPIAGMHVNGQLTLGENIADLAGLTIADAAYRLSLNGKAPPVLDGFSGEQRLFLGFGQVWRYKAREASARSHLLSDPHSPPEFRVNGTVRNVDAWYDAFDVMPGMALYLAPDARVHLW